jgi:uncharacterized protein
VTPPLRTGIGLRHPHYREVQDDRPAAGFLEVHSENYFGAGGRDLHVLSTLRRDYRISLHGVGLSIGSADALAERHLARLGALVERIEPDWVSEHLCWGAFGGQHTNDLLPLPYTRDALALLTARVDAVQTRLKRRILIENISAYVEFAASEMSEFEFIAALADASGCGVLLDLNNIYVNAINHGFDAQSELDKLPLHHVGEIHLAGHFAGEDCLIDHHGDHVCDAVWQLFGRTVMRGGPKPTLIEWDTNIPPLEVLMAEAARADAVTRAAITEAALD